MKSLFKKLLLLTLFSIAMGFMESAVVVYLRKIYYPNGFRFPLTPIDNSIASIEFLREAATLIMLLAIGILAGKRPSQRFALFIYCFAIWDLFYYIFLKFLLDWPESFFTWDILFLIPVPWVGPVLAPCLISMTMILLTLSIIYFQEKGCPTGIIFKEWMFFILGSLVVIYSFVQDYLNYPGHLSSSIWNLSKKKDLFGDISHYSPATFNWWMFLAGEALILFGIWIFLRRLKNPKVQLIKEN